MNELKLKDLVFDFVYGIALNDATNRVSSSGEKAKIAKNEEIRCCVKKYAEGVINGDEMSFNKTVDEIKAIDKNLTFGKIQKLINMTMKYMYIRYYDDETVKKRFNNCHAPMDSIMSTFVYESYFIVKGKTSKDKGNLKPKFKRDVSWSQIEENINRDQYDGFQEAVSEIIKDKDLNINRIEFDYRYWDVAKRVKYSDDSKERNQDGRIEETKSIWGAL